MELTRSLSRVPWQKSGHANRDPAWRSLSYAITTVCPEMRMRTPFTV